MIFIKNIFLISLLKTNDNEITLNYNYLAEDKMKLPTLSKNNKLFWLYIVIGCLMIVLSVFLAPIWGKTNLPWKNLGLMIINLIIALCLSFYLFGFLLKKIIKTKGKTIKILTIVEFSLLFTIDLFLVIGQWVPQVNVININGACAIIGFALWTRGVVEIIRAYYYQSDNEDKYPIWWLLISILFVSIGVWMMVKPFIQDIVIVWILVGVLFVIGIAFITYGIYAKPVSQKDKSKEEKKSNK